MIGTQRSFRSSIGVLATVTVLLVHIGRSAIAVDQPAVSRSPSKSAERGTAPIFETSILPIFKAKCLGCHNPKTQKAELDLSSFSGVLQGSESGEILIKNKPGESLLYEMIHEGLMPPKGKTPLTKAEIAAIRRWIATGAAAKTVVSEIARLSQHDVVPIMNLRCTVCHGLRLQEAGLDLRTRASMLKGGKSGPAIVLGKPKESLLLKRIHALEMPPRKKLVDFGVRPIETPEIETLTNWIAQGAPEIDLPADVATAAPDPLVTDEDRDFWAFQPPKRSAVPTVKHQDRVRNAIDAFVLRKLEEQVLSLSDEADRVTLIRRVSFDLTGLPPEWDAVEEFLADESPRAYQQMVDRFLESPHYGERWGRYWLDLAGYADSEGKRSADVIRPHAWRYRDYVIRAFNSDKPYDRFLLEQIAGDELADYENEETLTPEILDNLVATGFLRMAPDGTGSDIVNTVVERMEVVVDEIDVFSSAVLGLTMKCAQCHAHKYDPIPQRDYYRLVAVFKGAYDVHDWLKSTSVGGQTKGIPKTRLLPIATAQEKKFWKDQKAKIESEIATLKNDLQKKQQQLTEKHVETRLAKLPKELRDDLRKMLKTPAKKRDAVQKYLASKFEKRLRIDAKTLKKLEPDFKKRADQTEKKIKTLTDSIPAEPGIRALWDRGVPTPTYIFRRGEYTNPGRLVGPGVPSVLTSGKTPFDVKPPWPGAKQTGRRLALAKWLIDPNHPLTARVIVNRIWKHHFGRGIVKSLDDFGRTGTGPSHPQLLDWLAREFISPSSPSLQKRERPGGWSIKRLHRLILTSSTYRQVSAISPKLLEIDPENEFLSRMPLTRMDAESVRDGILMVAGKLDRRQFGTPDPVTVRADGLVTSQGTGKGWRRSVYVRQRRKEMPTILENFDLPQMIPNCIERPNSTVASQALHLLNDSLIRKLTGHFADRVMRESGNEPYRQIERAYQIALSRRPTEEEREIGREFLSKLTEQWKKQLENAESDNSAGDPAAKALSDYCHTIINSAAFLYVD